MISVATTFDLDRNPSSFFPMEIPKVSSTASPDPQSRASESIDLSLLSVHGFKTGDMVWGKVKSHPWWPGLIYNEAFATPSVRRSRQENHVLVAFFGDSSYGWFDPSELIPFSPNFPEKSKQTTLRSFLVAVDESVDEFSRRAALGLTCKCRNPKNFRPRKVPNYFAVDVPGFERGGIYSADQIARSREEFVPGQSLAFVRQLALAPTGADTSDDVEWTKRISVVLAYRRATYEEFDVPYAEAFGVQLDRRARDSPEEEPEKFAPRGIHDLFTALGDRNLYLNYFDCMFVNSWVRLVKFLTAFSFVVNINFMHSACLLCIRCVPFFGMCILPDCCERFADKDFVGINFQENGKQSMDDLSMQ